jgi:hypothetical protein
MKANKYLPVVGAAAAAIAILLLMILWSRSASRPESGQVPAGERGGASRAPADASLPAEMTPAAESVTVHDFGLPDEWFVAGALGQTYTETLTGVGLRVGETSVYLGQSPPDGPYLPEYVVGRAYPAWDTSLLPDDAKVLSATLILELPAGGGREAAFDVTIYRDTWTPPFDLEDWSAPGQEAAGCWHLPASRITERETVNTGQGLTLYVPEPARTVRVPLDPTVVEVAGITRLELRHAGEGVPPSTAEIVSLGRSQITLEVEVRP